MLENIEQTQAQTWIGFKKLQKLMIIVIDWWLSISDQTCHL